MQTLGRSIAAMNNEPQEGAPYGRKASLGRIKKELNHSGRFQLQGSLLKRSDTLRKWNQRWFTLDPTTGKLEYRIERVDIAPKGVINLDSGSSVIISPINLQGSIKYDGCCIYIQTSAKKEYFLCAETPGAAHAWVSTLRAAILVLKARKEAVTLSGGNGLSAVETIAAAVAAANATAKEAAKEMPTASQSSTFLAPKFAKPEGVDKSLDSLSIMKETLQVKDDELRQMAKDIRAKDAIVLELIQQLSAKAEAAEAAASVARTKDKERKAIRSEITQLRKELDVKLQQSSHEVRTMRERLTTAEKARDDALKESHIWQAELGKAREHLATMQAALDQAEWAVRQITADAEVETMHSYVPPGESEVRDVPLPGQWYASHDKEVELESPKLTTHQQIHDNVLSSMQNGIEELLLDLEFVEKKSTEMSFNPS